MNKLAIIDIDGVLSDSSARFAKAEEAKATYLATQDMKDAAKHHGLDQIRKEADKVYWQTAFTPELVALDTLIDGVPQALEQIERAGYDVLFLTSRPESMRQTTVDWFWSLSPNFVVLDGEGAYRDQLIMKPASQQFVKTITWKSGIVELLVRLFGVDELLYVDDEQAHCNAVEALDLDCDRILCGNLQEAIVSIGGDN